ncbi:MAG: ABC transporter ATP-binding protein [Granulosicoccus sp.]|nr:ABC transporter ATP-binding protein [Granulosicoccus sp.]
MLQVHAITRHYGELKAVDNVSFSIEKGEIVGLLGHNGAGKTTIMKMLSGYLEPDSGGIEFHGYPVSTEPQALQKELGYLPENPPIYPELSVASYLDYAAELKGLTRNDKRQAIKTVVESTELGDKLLSPIATLSRGMKQRVGVAQAIIGSPSLLILDEPTNGLDPTQTEQMRQLIRNISESATVILSTHIMQEVEALCDRALIIRQGQLAVDARLHDLTQSNRVAVRTSHALDSIKKALASESWLLEITERRSQSDTANHNQTFEFILQLDGSADVQARMADIARLMVSHDIPLMGLSADTQDLQSLFVKVNSDAHSVNTKKKPSSDDQQQEVSHVA